jgi:hypothetical protein
MGTEQLDWEKGILPAGYSTAVSGDGTPSILVRWRMPSPDGGVDHGEAVAALRRCGVEAGYGWSDRYRTVKNIVTD